MDRSLEELKLRAVFVLRLSPEARKEFVGVAREKSPSSAFDLALTAARAQGIEGLQAIAAAKATRRLAMIRRDHGEKVFEQIIA